MTLAIVPLRGGELRAGGLHCVDRCDAMTVVIMLIALQLIDHAPDPRADVPHVAIASHISAPAPIHIAAACWSVCARTRAILTIVVEGPLLGFDQLRARILQVVDRIDAVAAVVALIVLQLIDGAVETAMNLR